MSMHSSQNIINSTEFSASLKSSEPRNQADQILAYLKTGHTLTAIEALRHFQCFRLAARIRDLRKIGIPIETQEITEQGKRFAVYRLIPKESTAEMDQKETPR